MNMGSAAVTWSCKKQDTIANSTAEAEYISAWEAACEIVWLRRILQDLKKLIRKKQRHYLLIINQQSS